MRKTAVEHAEDRPNILARIVAIFGSQNRFCRAIGIATSQPPAWKKFGYIPAEYALDIHDLKLRDEWGPITCIDVLEEHRRVRRELIRNAGRD